MLVLTAAIWSPPSGLQYLQVHQKVSNQLINLTCGADQLTNKAINEVEFPIALSYQRRGWSRAHGGGASMARVLLSHRLSSARVLSEFERNRRRAWLYSRRDRPGCDYIRILGSGRGTMMRYKVIGRKV